MAVRNLSRHTRSRLARASTARIEPLEQRRLLTTLQAGDVFEWIDGSGATQRARFTGSGMVELVGLNFDFDNDPILHNIPGTVRERNGQPVNIPIFGGVGGTNGSDPINQIYTDTQGNIYQIAQNAQITLDATGLPTGGPLLFPGSDDNSVTAIASNSRGRLWGFNVSQIPNPFDPDADDITVGGLFNFDYRGTSDGLAFVDVAPLITGGTGEETNNLVDIISADFSPLDPNKLYFVAIVTESVVGTGGQRQEVDMPILYVYNLGIDDPTLALTRLGRFRTASVLTPNNIPDVAGITFTDDGELVAYVTARSGPQGANTRSGFVTLAVQEEDDIAPGEPNARFAFGRVLLTRTDADGTELNDVTNIQIIPRDRGFIYAVDGTDLWHVDLRTGKAINYGTTLDPQDANAQNQRGANIGALAWIPTLRTPLTLQDGNPANDFQRGVFVATDIEKDELIILNPAPRFEQSNLFNVYISGTDDDSHLAIATVPTFNPQTPGVARPMLPFTGSAGALRVRNDGVLDGDPTIEVTPRAGSGASFIGARTLDIFDNTVVEQNVAVRRVRRPNGLDLGIVPEQKFVYAGVEVTSDIGRFYFGGTITGRVYLGGNVDQFYAGTLLTGLPTGRFYGLNSRTGTVLVDPNERYNSVRRNFFVNGDIRNLATFETIGGVSGASEQDNMDYSTGFDMYARGRIGQVKSLRNIVGSIKAENNPNVRTNGRPQNELEFYGPNLNSGQTGLTYFEGNNGVSVAPTLGDLRAGEGGAADDFSNDSFQTPQMLSTAYSTELDSDEVIVIDGSHSLDNTGFAAQDGVDFFGLPLIAGQRVTVGLTVFSGLANYGVFDPDGRLIATDYSNVDPLTTLNQPFVFVADRPGVYRIAVSIAGDFNFNEIGDIGETVSRVFPTIYRLTVSRGVADIAIGGVVAGTFAGEQARGSILNIDPQTNPVAVLRGDIGSLYASGGIGGGQIDGGTFFGGTIPDAIYAERGNIRSVEGRDLGLFRNETAGSGFEFGTGPKFIAPRGVLGLVRAAQPDSAVLSMNDLGIRPSDSATTLRYSVVDVQLVDASGGPTQDFFGAVLARRAIGVIRANNMDNRANDRAGVQGTTVIPPPIIAANTDGRDSDGVIDLIRVRGAMGRSFEGGPAISAGPGGNVRYIRVDGPVFRDVFFGNASTPQFELYNPGERVRATDDSGATYTLTPTPLVQSGGQFGSGNQEVINPGRLAIVAYPIRSALAGGKAGDVLITVVAGDPAGAGRGLTVESGTSGGKGSVEIGFIDVAPSASDFNITYDGDRNGNGIRGPLDTTETQSPFIVTGATQGIDLVFRGPRRVDVFDVRAALTDGSRTWAGLNSIVNSTDGEIVNLRASDVADISVETLGLARSSTGTNVEGFYLDPSPGLGTHFPVDVQPGAATNVVADLFPFSRPRNMVMIRHASDSSPGIGVGQQGIIQSLRTRRGVGNVIVSGVLGSLVANSDRRDVKGVFEGINAPIVVLPTTDASDLDDGRILTVDIGEGILPSGTGFLSRAGIYAGDTIFTIRNQGLGSDIRGDIMAGAVPSLSGAFAFDPGTEESIFTIRLDNGAIINADIMVTGSFTNSLEYFSDAAFTSTIGSPNTPRFEIGQININGIGGIIGTQFAAPDVGPITINGGFGFINSEINGVTSDGVIAGIVTDGYGIRGSFIDGGAIVQNIHARGDGTRLDTRFYTGSVRQSETQRFDPFFNDQPNRLTDLHAFLGTTRTAPKRKGWSNAGVVADTVITGSRDLQRFNAWSVQNRFGAGEIPPTEPEFPMRISFAQNIGNFKVRSNIEGMQMSAGSINTVSIDGDLIGSSIGVAGRVRTFAVGGTFRGTSSLLVTGAEGTIDNLSVRKALFGEVRSVVDIGTLTVGTDFGSPFVSASRNIGTANIARDVLSGSTLRARNRIDNLVIGNDLQVNAVVTSKQIRNQQIGGDVFGEIRIG